MSRLQRTTSADRHQLFADGFDLVGRDLRQAVGEADEEGQIGQAIDLARQAVREVVEGLGGVGGEDFACCTRGLQAMADIGRRF